MKPSVRYRPLAIEQRLPTPLGTSVPGVFFYIKQKPADTAGFQLVYNYALLKRGFICARLIHRKYILIRKIITPIRPVVKSAPSRNAWNPIMFNVIGRSRSDAKATLLVHRQTSEIRNTTAIMIMVYCVSISIFINSYPCAVLYMSGVGAGKIPRTPNIGIINIKLNITFNIVFIIFIYVLYSM